mmetsp:Transcript_18063/g.23599  ORF Transcript_18063/g.23599 Transcript_18063/m.23599 type:complete len:863 (-) Transcript_18063:861-3449(-)
MDYYGQAGHQQAHSGGDSRGISSAQMSGGLGSEVEMLGGNRQVLFDRTFVADPSEETAPLPLSVPPPLRSHGSTTSQQLMSSSMHAMPRHSESHLHSARNSIPTLNHGMMSHQHNTSSGLETSRLSHHQVPGESQHYAHHQSGITSSVGGMRQSHSIGGPPSVPSGLPNGRTPVQSSSGTQQKRSRKIMSLETLKSWVKCGIEMLKGHPKHQLLQRLTPERMKALSPEPKRVQLMKNLVLAFGASNFKKVYEKSRRRSISTYTAFQNAVKHCGTAEELNDIKNRLAAFNARANIKNLQAQDKLQILVRTINATSPELFRNCRAYIMRVNQGHRPSAHTGVNNSYGGAPTGGAPTSHLYQGSTGMPPARSQNGEARMHSISSLATQSRDTVGAPNSGTTLSQPPGKRKRTNSQGSKGKPSKSAKLTEEEKKARAKKRRDEINRKRREKAKLIREKKKAEAAKQKEKEKKQKDEEKRIKAAQEKRLKEQKRALALAAEKRKKARIAKMVQKRKEQAALRAKRPVIYELDFFGGVVAKKRVWDRASLTVAEEESLVKRFKPTGVPCLKKWSSVVPTEVVLGIIEDTAKKYLAGSTVKEKLLHESSGLKNQQPHSGVNDDKAVSMPSNTILNPSSQAESSNAKIQSNGLGRNDAVLEQNTSGHGNSHSSTTSVSGMPKGLHKPNTSTLAEDAEEVAQIGSLVGSCLDSLLRSTLSSLVNLSSHQSKCRKLKLDGKAVHRESILSRLDSQARCNALRSKLYHTNKDLKLLRAAQRGGVRRAERGKATRLLKKEKDNPGSLLEEKEKTIANYRNRSKAFYEKLEQPLQAVEETKKNSLKYRMEKKDLISYLRSGCIRNRQLWLSVLNE